MSELTPGIHDCSVDEYHRDEICPEPSLSHSGIVTLLSGEPPSHFAARHPRLTTWPDLIDQEDDDYGKKHNIVLGQVIHRLVLGKGHDVALITGFDNWKKKDAQALRNEARANRQIPCLEPMYMQASAVADKLMNRLQSEFGGWPIGESEVPIFWRRKTVHGPIWCRALLDHFSKTACTVVDIKTTELSLTDEALSKKIAGEGADIQSAFYTEGVYEIFPELAGFVQFLFAFVQVEPPYSIRLKPLTESWLTRSRFRIDRAADKFADCLRQNEWPDWPVEKSPLSPPSWLEARWETEELSEVAS